MSRSPAPATTQGGSKTQVPGRAHAEKAPKPKTVAKIVDVDSLQAFSRRVGAKISEPGRAALVEVLSDPFTKRPRLGAIGIGEGLNRLTHPVFDLFSGAKNFFPSGYQGQLRQVGMSDRMSAELDPLPAKLFNLRPAE